MDKKTTGIVIAGAGTGTALPVLMREFVDDKWSVEQLGNWGKPSVLFGVITGALGVGAGVMAKRLSDEAKAFLVSYGVPALVEGLLFGIFPKQTQTTTTAAKVVYPTLKVTKTPTVKTAPVKVTSKAESPAIMISE